MFSVYTKCVSTSTNSTSINKVAQRGCRARRHELVVASLMLVVVLTLSTGCTANHRNASSAIPSTAKQLTADHLVRTYIQETWDYERSLGATGSQAKDFVATHDHPLKDPERSYSIIPLPGITVTAHGSWQDLCISAASPDLPAGHTTYYLDPVNGPTPVTIQPTAGPCSH
jgi:hypothetical protein